MLDGHGIVVEKEHRILGCECGWVRGGNFPIRHHKSVSNWYYLWYAEHVRYILMKEAEVTYVN